MFTNTHNFSMSALYRQPSESLKGFLKKRWSFWLALFSCIAFLVGNMVGQHGFKAFWKSVWGKEQIAFEGTTFPLAKIPDPARWSGRSDRSTFSDVPESLLIPLPAYTVASRCVHEESKDRRVYSVDYAGDYESGHARCGAHSGIDILTPLGTPVMSIANGFVERVEERSWGYGNTVVISHPGVPDEADPRKVTTLYSSYAHLGAILVLEGDIVNKGQQIAVSGQTGFATAPHLHFQIDAMDAPFHPYWPFSTAEATKAGLSFVQAVDKGLGQENLLKYTINPLVYVQEYLQVGPSMVITQAPPEVPLPVSPPALTWKERMQSRRSTRITQRNTTKLASKSAPTPAVLPSTTVTPTATISMLHDGTFEERTTEQLVIFARDKDGKFLQKVEFPGTIYLETVFGDAEFQPHELTASSFDDRGRAFVEVLPRGRKTIIPAVRGVFTVDGQPMVHSPALNTTSALSQGEGG